VIGVPHADFGEAAVAIVAPKPGTQIDEKQVQAAIAGDLAKYKQPKRVFVTSDIPRNTMGKIQTKDLRETYSGTFGGPQARP
jgi:malonyl-CoA/methylmalonyl-CoA synthetase